MTGNQGVQVLTWRERTNHWTLIESWDTRQNFYNSLEDPRVIAIRTAIASYSAAPSDLRLYLRVDVDVSQSLILNAQEVIIIVVLVVILAVIIVVSIIFAKRRRNNKLNERLNTTEYEQTQSSN